MYVVRFIVSTKGDVKAVAKDTGKVCYNTVINGTNSIIDMCGILAGSQITVSLINLTGFGVKLSDVIVSIGQGNMFLCLLCSMLVCIILGMGLPTDCRLCARRRRARAAADYPGCPRWLRTCS